MMRFALIAALLVPLWAAPALAVTPDEVLSDPVLEGRARDISAELRCMVCQNQSIDDSDAPLAKDLRVLVRERLVAGDSDEAVLDFIVARYGEYVLLRPVVGGHTLVLWFGAPALFLLGAIGIGTMVLRRRKAAHATPAAAPLSAAEAKRVAQLLERDGGH